MSDKTFYFGSAFNLPNAPNQGARNARVIIHGLEALTADRCTSRWPWSGAHYEQGDNQRTIAVTDLADISRADYAIIYIPTPTARGAHVEIGFALAMDKPVYLFRKGDDSIGFDVLCKEWKPHWRAIITDGRF